MMSRKFWLRAAMRAAGAMLVTGCSLYPLNGLYGQSYGSRSGGPANIGNTGGTQPVYSNNGAGGAGQAGNSGSNQPMSASPNNVSNSNGSAGSTGGGTGGGMGGGGHGPVYP